MPIPAGSKGGFFGPLRDTGHDVGEFATRLLAGEVTHHLHRVKTLGIYINSVCNLACAHCYYQIDSGYRGKSGLCTGDLISALDSALETDVQLFAFVGKEVFLPGPHGADKTLAAMEHLAAARRKGRRLRLGAVTNGFFVEECGDRLREVGLDFLDISFDGHDAATHDRLRGAGAYARSTRNLAHAVRVSLASKVFVASTLYSGNLETLPEILDFNERYGVAHFSIMPIIPVQQSEQGITVAELLAFLTRALPNKIERLPAGDRIEFVMDLDSYVFNRGRERFSTLLEGATVELDSLNNVLLRRRMGRVNLVMRFSLPDPCNSYGCLTHDGLYFDKGGCLFMKTGYEAHALGSAMSQPLAALIRRHGERAREVANRMGPALFDERAFHLTNTMERTDFYAIPEIA